MDSTPVCHGHPSPIQPARLALLCTSCWCMDANAPQRLPGFAGSTCASYVLRPFRTEGMAPVAAASSLL